MKKEHSGLITDINSSIAKAYDSKLSQTERSEVKAHLEYTLPTLSAPNTLIQPIKDALQFISQQEAQTSSWKNWLAKPVVVGLISAILTTPIAYYVGVAIEKAKISDCKAN